MRIHIRYGFLQIVSIACEQRGGNTWRVRRGRMQISISAWVLGVVVLLPVNAQERQPVVPRAWDDHAIASLEVPLVYRKGSPKHVSSEYYYKIPVRPIYRSYPIYAPGRGPAGYMEWLKREEPEVLWDDSSHAPSLRTESDRWKAGALVFDSPLFYDQILT